MAGGIGLIRASSCLRGQVLDVRQVTINLTRYLGLFFRGAGYHDIAVIDLRDAERNSLQHFPGLCGQALRLRSQGPTIAHCGNGLIRALLYGIDHPFDFNGR